MILLQNMMESIRYFSYRIYSCTWIKAIRYGLINIQPIIFIGCIITIITKINSTKYLGYTNGIFNEDFILILDEIYKQIYVLTKMLIVISITYSFADIKKYTSIKNKKINSILIPIIGIVSALILTYKFDISYEDNIDAKWLFVGTIISLIASEMYIFIDNKIEKKLKSLKERFHIEIKVLISIIITIFIIITGSIIVRFFIDNYVSSNINIIIQNYKIGINSSNEFLNTIKNLFMVQIAWFFGGHGTDIIGTSIIDKSYINVFSNIGGAGSTLSLLIAILLVNINKRNKRTSKICILPSIFNVNEPTILGLPIMFNPIYIIPFIVTPIVLGTVTMIAINLNIITIQNTNVDYIVPIFLNAYSATGSINGCIFQILNIIIGVFIYIPFIKLDNEVYRIEKQAAYNKFENNVLKNKCNDEINLLSESYVMSEIYDMLSQELRQSILLNEQIHLEYQSKVSKQGNIVGVEALLRWNHNELGEIPSNIIINMAEETDITDMLVTWIMENACFSLQKFNEILEDEIDMYIDISSIQLINKNFTKNIKKIIDKYNISYTNITLEIRESVVLDNRKRVKKTVEDISKLGIKLVIDDFVEARERKIVSDKTEEGIHQGYLYSKPLDFDKFIKYIKEVENEKYKQK